MKMRWMRTVTPCSSSPACQQAKEAMMTTTMKMTIGMTMVLRERLWRSTARLWTTTMERTSISSSLLPCSVGHHSHVSQKLRLGADSLGPLGSSMVLLGPGSFRCNLTLRSRKFWERGNSVDPSSNPLCLVFVVLLKNIVALEVMLVSCLTHSPTHPCPTCSDCCALQFETHCLSFYAILFFT